MFIHSIYMNDKQMKEKDLLFNETNKMNGINCLVILLEELSCYNSNQWFNTQQTNEFMPVNQNEITKID